MDLLGKTVREFLKVRHDQDLKKANAMVVELRKEGMRKAEIEEMLYASGYDDQVVQEVMESLPKQKKQ